MFNFSSLFLFKSHKKKVFHLRKQGREENARLKSSVKVKHFYAEFMQKWQSSKGLKSALVLREKAWNKLSYKIWILVIYSKVCDWIFIFTFQLNLFYTMKLALFYIESKKNLALSLNNSIASATLFSNKLSCPQTALQICSSFHVSLFFLST